jgi:hypothetical protein
VRVSVVRIHLATWIVVVLALAACGSREAFVRVPADEVLFDGSGVLSVEQVRWSPDGSEIAFAVHVDYGQGFRAYRLPVGGASAAMTAVATFTSIRDLGYTLMPGGLAIVAGFDALPSEPCRLDGAFWFPTHGAGVELSCEVIDVADVFEPWSGDVVPRRPLLATTARAVAFGVTEGIVVVDATSLERTLVGVGVPVAFDPSGELLLAVVPSGGGRTWNVVERAGQTTETLPITADHRVLDVRWTETGLVLLLDAPPRVWNVHTGTVVDIGVLGTAIDHVTAPQLSPSGRVVAYAEGECLQEFWACTSYRAAIWTIDVATLERHLIYQDGSNPRHLAIAPDDSSIVFTGPGGFVYRSALP